MRKLFSFPKMGASWWCQHFLGYFVPQKFMQNCINIRQKLSRDFRTLESIMQFCMNVLHESYKNCQVGIRYKCWWKFESLWTSKIQNLSHIPCHMSSRWVKKKTEDASNCQACCKNLTKTINFFLMNSTNTCVADRGDSYVGGRDTNDDISSHHHWVDDVIDDAWGCNKIDENGGRGDSKGREKRWWWIVHCHLNWRCCNWW